MPGEFGQIGQREATAGSGYLLYHGRSQCGTGQQLIKFLFCSLHERLCMGGWRKCRARAAMQRMVGCRLHIRRQWRIGTSSHDHLQTWQVVNRQERGDTRLS